MDDTSRFTVVVACALFMASAIYAQQPESASPGVSILNVDGHTSQGVLTSNVIEAMPEPALTPEVEIDTVTAACDDECVEGEDKFPTFKATGFFHLDGARFSQDANNRRTLDDVPDGLGFRRARIAATGDLTEDVSYIMEFDFAVAQPLFVDVWVNFSDVPWLGNVRIGRWRQPFGMTELTSIREIPFLERPLPFALSPFRATGIGFYDHADDERVTWALSGYRFFSDFFGNVVGDNGGYGLAGRVTYLPIDRGGNRVVHVGADYTYNEPARDNLLFVSFPEVFVGQSLALVLPAPIDGTPFFVNTGLLPANNYHGINLEAAAARGPFAIQAEARWAVVKQLGAGTVTLPGAYVHVRYVLTGESIPYDRKNGVFRQVEPRNPTKLFKGCGAWEVAARLSHVDLDGTIGDGPGRSLTSVTLGLNWHLNRHVKFQLNYIRALLDDPMIGRSEADIFALRTQMSF